MPFAEKFDRNALEILPGTILMEAQCADTQIFSKNLAREQFIALKRLEHSVTYVWVGSTDACRLG